MAENRQELHQWLDRMRARAELESDPIKRSVVEIITIQRALTAPEAGPPPRAVVEWLSDLADGKSYDADRAREVLRVLRGTQFGEATNG